MNKFIEGLNQISPLTYAAVFFVSGILVFNFASVPIFILSISAAALLLTAFLLRSHRIVFPVVFLLFCFVLGGMHSENNQRLSKGHISSLSRYVRGMIRVRGVIDSDPVYQKGKLSFVFRVSQVFLKDSFRKSQGKILVNLFSSAEFSYGDELILEGRLYRPFDFNLKPGFSWKGFLKNRGIYHILSVKADSRVIVLAKAKGNPVKSSAFRIKRKLGGIFRRYLWPVNSHFLSGIILGDRQGIPGEIKAYFVRTGTAHIIAISGFHIGVILFVILLLLKFVRLGRKIRYLMAIPLLFMYMHAVGGGPSVVRAAIMAAAMLGAYLVNRKPHIINSLSLSALVILACNPRQVFDVGFQLSFVSVLAIVMISPKIMNIFKLKLKPFGIFRVMINGFAVSLAVWLATFGFVAYYFRIISPVSILANLIIVPFVSLVILLGFCLIAAGLICPPLAVYVGICANFVMLFLFKTTQYISSLPFAYFYLSRIFPARL